MPSREFQDSSVISALELLISGNLETYRDSEDRIAGKYAVKRIISCEGQATVVHVRDETLYRDAVLKIYNEGLTENQKKRLKNEARALAQIKSPNVVRCYNVEKWRNMPFLVLEHVEGRTLSAMVAKDGLSLSQKIELFEQLANGVQAAHDVGVLHRDIKPNNVLVTPEGEVKLIDFGLVQSLELEGGDSGSGTPAFMAPEVANGESTADVRSDVFGLGGILYFLLTGKAPFDADSNFESRLMARSGQVKPIAEAGSVGFLDLEKLCMKCLDVSPDGRFDSVSQVLKNLDRVFRRRRTSRILWASMVAVLACVLVFYVSTMSAASDQETYQSMQDQVSLADDSLINESVNDAIADQKEVCRIATAEYLRESFLVESELRLDFIERGLSKLKDADRKKTIEYLKQIDRLKLAISRRSNRVEVILKKCKSAGVLDFFEEKFGSKNVATLQIRYWLLFGQLQSNRQADFNETQDKFAELFDDCQQTLGLNSNLVLTMLESLANEWRMKGMYTKSLKLFDQIYSASRSLSGSGQRFAAAAQLERAMLIAETDEFAARNYYEDFLYRQDDLQTNTPSLLEFIDTELEFKNGDLDTAIDKALSLIESLSLKASNSFDLVRRIRLQAQLCEAYALKAQIETVAGTQTVGVSEPAEPKSEFAVKSDQMKAAVEEGMMGFRYSKEKAAFFFSVTVDVLEAQIALHRENSVLELAKKVEGYSKDMIHPNKKVISDAILQATVLKIQSQALVGDKKSVLDNVSLMLRSKRDIEPNQVDSTSPNYFLLNTLPKFAVALNKVGGFGRSAKIIKTASSHVKEVKAFMPEHQALADEVQARLDQIELQLQND